MSCYIWKISRVLCKPGVMVKKNRDHRGTQVVLWWEALLSWDDLVLLETGEPLNWLKIICSLRLWHFRDSWTLIFCLFPPSAQLSFYSDCRYNSSLFQLNSPGLIWWCTINSFNSIELSDLSLLIEWGWKKHEDDKNMTLIWRSAFYSGGRHVSSKLDLEQI